MVELIANVNNAINGFVWGVPMLVLLVGTGILMTILTKFFQLSHIGHWFKNTVGGIFHDQHVTKHTDADDQSISQFQSLCTALAATIGTGNIVGVASALVAGGPGAIFWMWIVAFFGMMTNYSENVLGIYYRRKNFKGEWSGGAMYYLKDGLGSYKGCKQIGAVLAVLFSAFCLLASFGIGNMSQVNSIAANMTSAFSIPATVTGIVLVIIGALVIVGGLKRIAAVTEKLGAYAVVNFICTQLDLQQLKGSIVAKLTANVVDMQEILAQKLYLHQLNLSTGSYVYLSLDACLSFSLCCRDIGHQHSNLTAGLSFDFNLIIAACIIGITQSNSSYTLACVSNKTQLFALAQIAHCFTDAACYFGKISAMYCALCLFAAAAAIAALAFIQANVALQSYTRFTTILRQLQAGQLCFIHF